MSTVLKQNISTISYFYLMQNIYLFTYNQKNYLTIFLRISNFPIFCQKSLKKCLTFLTKWQPCYKNSYINLNLKKVILVFIIISFS